MRTVNEVCETYRAVFERMEVIVNGHILSSDGVYWFVNNIPVDTITNKKKEFLFLLDDIKALKELAKKVGINDDLIESNFYLLHDTIDDMLLLVYNDDQVLNIIYSTLSYVYIEQIEKQLGEMDFTKVSKEKSMTQETTHYILSKKSIDLINGLSNQTSFKFSQNHFYEILPKEVPNFSELINKISVSEAELLE